MKEGKVCVILHEERAGDGVSKSRKTLYAPQQKSTFIAYQHYNETSS